MGPSPRPPSNISRYQLVAEIGRGGMGDVYLALQAGPAGFEKLIVLKTLQASLSNDPDFVDMFMDEAKLAARLSHPNIVQTNEVDHQDGFYFMAMEFLDGQPLQRIRTLRHKPEGTSVVELGIISQALLGLHYAHDLRDLDGSPLGVVHRDASPHNIFVTYDGFVKVVDFGIAKAMNSSHQTVAGTLKGKIRYMAPEQSVGANIDRRCDVFAMGVAMWEALAQRRMWPSDKPDAFVLHELSQGNVPRLSSLNLDIPDAIVDVCDRAAAPHPDDRYPSAMAFHEALDDAMDRTPGWQTSPKIIARYMDAIFGDERRKFRAKVDQQLGAMRAARTGEVRLPLVPAFETARNSHTPSAHLTPSAVASSITPSARSGEHSRPGHSRSGVSHPGAARSNPGFSSASLAQSGGSQAALAYPRPPHGSPAPRALPEAYGSAPAGFGQGEYSGAAIPQVGPQGYAGQQAGGPPLQSAPVPSNSGLFAVGGGLALLAFGAAAAGGVFYMKRAAAPDTPRTAEHANAGGSETAIAMARPAETSPQAAQITLNLSASPASAVLSIDGKPLPGNPLTKTFLKDAAAHTLHVEATGYTARDVSVMFDGDAKVQITLVKEDSTKGGSTHGAATLVAIPAAPSSASGAHKPVPVDTATTAVEPTGPKKPIRTIDPDYPGH